MGETDWFSPVSNGFCLSFTSVTGLKVEVILNLLDPADFSDFQLCEESHWEYVRCSRLRFLVAVFTSCFSPIRTKPEKILQFFPLAPY